MSESQASEEGANLHQEEEQASRAASDLLASTGECFAARAPGASSDSAPLLLVQKSVQTSASTAIHAPAEAAAEPDSALAALTRMEATPQPGLDLSTDVAYEPKDCCFDLKSWPSAYAYQAQKKCGRCQQLYALGQGELRDVRRFVDGPTTCWLSGAHQMLTLPSAFLVAAYLISCADGRDVALLKPSWLLLQTRQTVLAQASVQVRCLTFPSSSSISSSIK